MARHVLLAVLAACGSLLASAGAAENTTATNTSATNTSATGLQCGVPDTVYLAVYAKHNPERDYQAQYYQDIVNTVRETRIMERALEIVTSRAPQDNVEQAKAVIAEFQKALEPLDLQALAAAEEFVYAQQMEANTSQHLVLIRMNPEATAACVETMKNLFEMANKYSGGQLAIESNAVGDVAMQTLALPGAVPFQPTIARRGDVVVFSSKKELAEASLRMLAGEGGKSKFDDPRLQAALKKLPAPEDALTFYDGKMQFEQMGGMFDQIRAQAGGDPEVQRVLGLFDQVIEQFSVVDFEVTVEYTDGFQNRTAAYGKLKPGVEDRLMYKMMDNEPFADWSRWVPKETQAFSLTSGANLHPLYEYAMKMVKENVPASEPILAQFDQMQEQVDVYLDRDILQAFPGPCVSITLASDNPSPFGAQDSVMALQCAKPERINELIHRGISKLQELPPVKSQNLRLEAAADMEGFDELKANIFGLVGIRPVIGFRDGWMFVGTSASAVQKVLATKAGEADSFASTDRYKEFNLDGKGTVSTIGYTNLAANTRQMAQLLNQVGMFAPVLIGMMPEQNQEEAKVVQEVLALLPSAARIIGKFDFLEANMSLTQAGPEPGSWMRQSVTLVREPTESASK